MTSRAVNPRDMVVEIVDHKGGWGNENGKQLVGRDWMRNKVQQAYQKPSKTQNCPYPRHGRRLALGRCPRSAKIKLITAKLGEQTLLADHRGSSAYVPAEGLSLSEKWGFLGAENFMVVRRSLSWGTAIVLPSLFHFLILAGPKMTEIER